MFSRAKTLGEAGIPEISSYIRELSVAMQRDCSLKLLPILHLCPPEISSVTQLMNFPVLCGHRIAGWLDTGHTDEVDLIASTTRSLFECWVTFQYLREDKFVHFENRALQMLQRDELDLIESSIKVIDPSIPVPAFAQKEHQRLKTANPPKVKRVSDLAKIAGVQDEYEVYYRLYCKYAHPSLYLMMGDQRVVFSEQLVRIIVRRSAWYLESFANMFSEFYENVLKKLAEVQARKNAG